MIEASLLKQLSDICARSGNIQFKHLKIVTFQIFLVTSHIVQRSSSYKLLIKLDQRASLILNLFCLSFLSTEDDKTTFLCHHSPIFSLYTKSPHLPIVFRSRSILKCLRVRGQGLGRLWLLSRALRPPGSSSSLSSSSWSS